MYISIPWREINAPSQNNQVLASGRHETTAVMKHGSKIHAKRSRVFYIAQKNSCTFKTTKLLLKTFLATSYIANTALL